MKNSNIHKLALTAIVVFSSLLSANLQAYERWKGTGASPLEAFDMRSSGEAVFISGASSNGLYRISWEDVSVKELGFGGLLPPLTNDGNVLYTAECIPEGGQPGFFNHYTNHIYWSVDNGDNWLAVGSLTTEKECVTHLAAKDDVLYAGVQYCPDILFKSVDGGNNWSQLTLPSSRNYLRNLLIHNDTLYFGGEQGLYKSIDEGNNWTDINNGLSFDELMVARLIFDGDTIYRSDYGTLYRSDNGGASWQRMNNAPSYSYASIAIRDNTFYLGTGNGVQKSSDAGNTWLQCGSLSGGAYPQTVFSLLADDNALYALGDLGWLFKSTDGCATWQGFKPEPLPQSVEKIAAAEDVLYVGISSWEWCPSAPYAFPCEKGILRSEDQGLHWTRLVTPFEDYREVISLAAHDQVVYAATENAVYKSSDRGESWMKVLGGITPRTLAFENEKVFVGTAGDTYRSLDGGRNWTNLSAGSGDYREILSITIKDGVIYISPRYHRHISRSTDDGNSWEMLQGQAFNFTTDVWNPRPMTVLDNGTIYVSDLSSIYKSSNGGGVWSAVRDGVGEYDCAEALSSRHNTAYMGTPKGAVLMLAEGQTRWSAVGEGLPRDQWVHSVVVDQDKVYAGTSHGLFSHSRH